MTTTSSEERRCLDCGERLYGRHDKKFCSDQCRNSYNNRQRKDTNDYMRKVNGVLKKNRRILESLNPDGKKKVKKEWLLKEGFDFDFHTNTYTTREGKTYHFCYEQGYLELNEEWYFLVKRKDDWN